MYLMDTNIWLERLLGQERSEEVRLFLESTPAYHFYVTDFSLHSIGVIMDRMDQREALLRFVDDVFIQGAAALVRLQPEDMEHLVQTIEQFGLDFDDAYQYVAAQKHDLIIVSFDKDFDGTDRGRTVPADLLKRAL